MSTATTAVAYADTADGRHDDADPGRTGQSTAADVSSYIADMCSGMIDMAQTAQLDVLAYILGMARLEAEMQNRRVCAAVAPRRRKRRTPPSAPSPAISPAS